MTLEFSFSKTGFHTKVKEPNMPFYLTIILKKEYLDSHLFHECELYGKC